jgi:hypothetical protein
VRRACHRVELGPPRLSTPGPSTTLSMPSQGILRTREQPWGITGAPPPPSAPALPKSCSNQTYLWLSSGSCLQSIRLSWITTGTQLCMRGTWACSRSPCTSGWVGAEPLSLAHVPQAFSSITGKEVGLQPAQVTNDLD